MPQSFFARGPARRRFLGRKPRPQIRRKATRRGLVPAQTEWLVAGSHGHGLACPSGRGILPRVVSKNLTHVSPFLNTLGGLESVLRHHRERDSRWHIDSRFVVLFE